MRGKPQVAIATITVPADSPNIIESKSFKLYLNSFNQTRLANRMPCWPCCARTCRPASARRCTSA